MKVVLSRQANLDLMAQIDWLARLSPSAALRADEVIRAGLKALEAFPSSRRIGRILHSRRDRG